jgi:hypothetical protein
MQTPHHKIVVKNPSLAAKENQIADPPNTRKSPRFNQKNTKGKSMTKLAQDLVAKKCGIMREEESLDKLTLQHYLDLYKQPLLDQSMEVILKLTEVAAQKEKKKKKLRKGKKADKLAMGTELEENLVKKLKNDHNEAKEKKNKIKTLKGAFAIPLD